MNQTEWKALVKEGIALAKQGAEARWGLGDNALKVAPIGQDGAHNGSADKLEQYASEIGVEYETLRRYRQVSASWPPETRVSGASWTLHRELLNNASPDEAHATMKSLGKKFPNQRITADMARQENGRQPSRLLRRTPSERQQSAETLLASATDKKEFIRKVISDPAIGQEIAHELMKDTKTAPVMRRASFARAQEAERELRDRDRQRSPGLAATSDMLDMATFMQQANTALKRVTKRAEEIEITDDISEYLMPGIEKLEVTIGWLRIALQPGAKMTDEITAFLAEAD
jgi:hypothetical protein